MMADANGAGDLRSDWILVTNDDGIDAVGIQILARTLTAAGYEVRIFAPDENYSGAGASLGSLAKREPVANEERELPGLAGVRAVAVGAPPAGCVMLGLRGAFTDKDDLPALVVSGINEGANSGRAVIFSGTIGAAMTATVLGTPGIAVSLAHEQDHDGLRDEDYERAAVLTVDLMRAVLSEGAPKARTYNLNVPSRRGGEVQGIAAAHPAAFGAVQTLVRLSPEGDIETEMVRIDSEVDPTSDTARLRERWATVSVLDRPESFDATSIVAAMVEQQS